MMSPALFEPPEGLSPRDDVKGSNKPNSIPVQCADR